MIAGKKHLQEEMISISHNIQKELKELLFAKEYDFNSNNMLINNLELL